MLDTVEFNHLLDGKISVTSLESRRVAVTGIQKAELGATKNWERRVSLFTVFNSVDPEILPTSSFALDIEGAGLDQAYLNDGSGNIEKMLSRLRELDAKNKNPLNQVRDVLIAETAIKNKAILVSHDDNLRKIVFEFGGRAIAQLP